MDMSCKYKDAFSVRDEIVTCPNIEVDIDATCKSPIFTRTYQVKEEDKAILGKDMKKLCY